MNIRGLSTAGVTAAPARADYIPVSVSRGKRLFDVACALGGLVLSAPLMPLLAVIIKVDSRGPVIYRQLRIGSSQPDRTELFWIYKLRSMTTEAEKNGAQWATANDPRITRVGLFLRKTRLDEIPQLWNVLRGDMSMIGPRPERPGFYQKLEQQIPYFAERTYGLKPGITGLAQVRQGYDRCIEDVRSKVGYDHAYALALTRIDSWLAMDTRIALHTLRVMVGRKGQ